MLGASFAAVPFYDWFCRVTGYGGTTGVAAAPRRRGARPLGHGALRRQHRAGHALGVPAEAADDAAARSARPALAFYEAYNPTDRPMAGQASFNVVPFAAGGYFAKIACFCFEMQVLGPGERVEMPVSFFVDPAMLEDLEARGVTDDHAVLHHAPGRAARGRARGRAGRPARGGRRRRTIEQ